MLSEISLLTDPFAKVATNKHEKKNEKNATSCETLTTVNSAKRDIEWIGIEPTVLDFRSGQSASELAVRIDRTDHKIAQSFAFFVRFESSSGAGKD
jgi:hypothetical protein